MKNIHLPDYHGLMVTDTRYKHVYIKSLGVLQENMDAKTMKQSAIKFARDRNIEPRAAFAALEDWHYSTLGKVAYLYSIGFPLAKNTIEWMNKKARDLVEEGKLAIQQNRNVEISPTVEKSEKKLTEEEIAQKIIQLVEEDKLSKDRDAPIKILSLEECKQKSIEKILTFLDKQFSIYMDEQSEEYQKIRGTVQVRSTMIRRRNEFGRIIQQVKHYIAALSTKG